MIESGDAEHVAAVMASFTRDNQQLMKQLEELLYWYRGALNRDDVWALTPVERALKIEFLNTRFEQAGELMKKSIQVFV